MNYSWNSDADSHGSCGKNVAEIPPAFFFAYLPSYYSLNYD